MPDEKPKVLVIDVDASFRAAMERTLEPLYRVTTFDGGAWTYAAIAALEPELIMLGVRLPEHGAFELCRALRADARFARTPILFFTSLRTDEDFRRYLSAGGSRFLNKVIDRRHLLAALAEELGAVKPAPAK